MKFPTPPARDPIETRPAIALRWWIDRAGALQTRWPSPAAQDQVAAMGWVDLNHPAGVIAQADPAVTPAMLNALDDRFPGRRWFERRWCAADAPARRAA